MRRSTGDQRGGGDPQKDDGVLVNNRLRKTLPVVDEVTLLEQVPEGVMAAVEVAAPGRWCGSCRIPTGSPPSSG